MGPLRKIPPAVWVCGFLLVAPSAVASVSDEHFVEVILFRSAQQDSQPDVQPAESNPAAEPGSSAITGDKPGLYHWWRRTTERESRVEPAWLSPLATTTGRIKNEIRYDMWRQTAPTGTVAYTFGGGKGLEFVAAPRLQFLLGIPPYFSHPGTSVADGFGDLPLMLKFRLASANASTGNYIVTFLLGATVPTASRPNGAGAAVLTPSFALGKGWGRFDVQTIVGANLPAADTARLGRQWLWNTALQYEARWKLWPELEVNSTFLKDGNNAGKIQTFLTPGLGFGRVRLFQGLRFSIAGGVQLAVTHFHRYNHRWMVSPRLSF